MQLLSLLVTSSTLTAAGCSTLSSPFLYYPHSSHRGTHRSEQSVSPHDSTTAGVLRQSACETQESSPLCWRCYRHIKLLWCYQLLQRRQEDGGCDHGTYCRSVCSSQTGLLNEKPSVIHLNTLFVSHSSQSLSALPLVIRSTATDRDVRL
ncbi:uncharacterized protein V6R79_016917 [Siganus canaliculatus]